MITAGEGIEGNVSGARNGLNFIEAVQEASRRSWPASTGWCRVVCALRRVPDGRRKTWSGKLIEVCGIGELA